MKTERGEYQFAWYDGTNWILVDYLAIETLSECDTEYERFENTVKMISKRNTRLYAIFVNAYIPGGVICSEPQMLFLHGIRYNLDDGGITPLQVIIDNARYMGL